MAPILLQQGTVLTHEHGHVVILKEHDVLVEGNVIKEIGKGLSLPGAGGRIISCRGKIISPGFVDTHHHLWQTQVF